MRNNFTNTCYFALTRRISGFASQSCGKQLFSVQTKIDCKVIVDTADNFNLFFVG